MISVHSLKEYTSDKPLSAYDRVKTDLDEILEAYPVLDYEIRGEKIPMVIKITNQETGEIRFIRAKKYDGKLNVTYSVAGKEYSFVDLYKFLVEEMI